MHLAIGGGVIYLSFLTYGAGGRFAMVDQNDDDQYSAEETEQRLQKMLQGAFSGPPTPLKDIPTRTGESRAVRKKKPQRRLRRQRKNRAA
jgi:hypothetical protein